MMLWRGMWWTYETDCAFLSQLNQQVEHFRRSSQTSWCECAIDVEETYCLFDRSVFEVWEGHVDWFTLSNGRCGKTSEEGLKA